MSAIKSKNRVWILLFCFLVAVFSYTQYGLKKVSASWFDDAWKYRVAIPISAHTSLETNVYITLSGSDGINTTDTTKFQTDCGDIRFVNEAGDILPYYLTTSCGLAQTGFQVYFENFPAGAQTIYYYYGNPSAPNGFNSTSMGVAASGVTLGTRGSESEAPSSPVVYFRLDEGTGQAVSNSMETVNNGTLGPDATVTGTDPTWRSEELCMVGKCLKFESTSSQYVNVANTIGGVKSVSFWVKPISTTTSLMVLNGAAGNASISVSSGTISAGAGFATPTIYVNGKVSSALVANEWQYVTVTTATGISASNIMIGRVNTGYLDGFIDEVKLYGSVIPVNQIKAGYASGLVRSSSIKNSAVSFGGGAASGTLTNGLVGYWKMDDNTGTTTIDSTGNGNTGTFTNSPTWGAGRFGTGVRLSDGTTNQYINVPSATSIDNLPKFTWSVWVNPSQLQNDVTLMRKSGNIDMYLENISSGLRVQLFLDCLGSSLTRLTTSADNLRLNQWNHIVFVYDGGGCALSNVQLYVNGTATTAHANSVSGSGAYDNSDAGSPLSIGNSTNLSRQILGSVDEVRVYNRALSSAEVSQLYDFAPGPIAHWKMDESTGQSVYDTSGIGNNATLGTTSSVSTDDPSWTIGKYGTGLLFDGTTDLVRADDSDSLSFGNGTTDRSFTISGWINPSVGTSRYVFNKFEEYEMRFGSDGRLICTQVDASTGGYIGRNWSGPVATNTWYHVSCTYDGSSTSAGTRIYVNGVRVDNANEASGSYTAMENTTNSFRLGDGVYTGKMDDMKMYNYVRSSGQVIEDMNYGETQAVAYWKFDEGTGTTANDSNAVIGSNESLTLSTATLSWTNTAKFGKAFSAGGARRLSRSDDSNLDFAATEDFSIGFWMKSSIASSGNPSATEYIVYKGPSGASNGGYGIYANTSGQICIGIDDDSTSFPEDSSCSSRDVYDNTWHHITAVKKGTNSLEIYVDTLLNGTPDTAISSTTNTLANTSTFYVGSANAVDDTDDYNGDIDELQIFRGALSVDQIKTFANSKSSSLGAVSISSAGVPDMSNSGVYCVPGDATSCSVPLLHWKMDERTGTTTTYDSSGNGRDGTLGGISNSDWVTGKYGSGINLDNSDDYISIADNDVFSVNNTNQLTVEAWVKLDSVSLTQEIVSKGSGSNYEWALRVNGDGTLYGYLYQSGGGDYMVTPFSSTLVTNTWYHIAMVANISTPSLKLYLNGNQIAEDTTSSGSYTNGTAAVRVGERADGLRDVDGVVDEVKIYGYARTGAQVAWDYNLGKPVAWWKMDEGSWNNNCSTDTVFDSSGNASHGDACPNSTGPVGGTTGKYNNAGAFDGNNDYVSLGVPSALNTRHVSVAAWVNLTTPADSVTSEIYNRTNSSNAGTVALRKQASDNKYLFQIRLDGTESTVRGISSNDVATTGWHHLVGTYDGTTVKLYLDGIQQTSTHTQSGNIDTDTLNSVEIGRNSAGSTFMKGSLDDVRVYNYALTAQQVKSVMSDGSVKIGPSVGAPN